MRILRDINAGNSQLFLVPRMLEMFGAMTDQPDWRDRLREELRAKGVRITKLSEELGFNRDYISKVLNKREHEPLLENVRRICDGAGIDFSALFKDAARDEREADILRRLATLTDDDLTRVGRLIDALDID